ncbi:tyrosine-type recombinase/integrase [Rhizobium ruizarguesonis]
MFLLELSDGLSLKTVFQYGWTLLDIFRLLHLWDGGAGLAWEATGEDFLRRWHLECSTVRKVKKATFNYRLALFLRFLQWAQNNGWTQSHIGVAGAGCRIQITHKEDGSIRHPLMKGKARKSKPRLPTTRVLDTVEAELATLRRKPAIIRRDHLLLSCKRVLTLRRSEVAGLRVEQIPSSLTLRKSRAEGKITIEIKVLRAKGAGERIVHFDLSMLEELRDFIDLDRPALLGRAKVDEGFIFCPNNRSGASLCLGYITNFYKVAANHAASRYPEDAAALKSAHVHHLRHKSVTDRVAGYLREGIPADEALLMVMDDAALSSIEMARHYLHLAEGDIRKESKEWKAAQADIERRSQTQIAVLRGFVPRRSKRR